jgi:PAS domain S-box-containing protein
MAEKDSVFERGGNMAARMAATDWSKSPLGPTAQWPQSLRAAVRIMLTSRFAMWMAWGSELTFFCNDAYLPTLGVKESWALGTSARKVWQEIWPDIGPRIDHVLTNGESTWDEGLLLFLERSGYSEETYHTFSYSPLSDDSGKIAGMLCVVTEETERVIGERRLFVLRDLSAELATVSTEIEIFPALERSLAKAAADLPFALVYLCSEDGRLGQLAATSGIKAGSKQAPAEINCAQSDAVWPFSEIEQKPILIPNLIERFADLPAGPWPKSPQQAIIFPLSQAGHAKPIGFFVAGLNPFRPLDDDYQSFIGLFVGQLSAGLTNARTFETERKRAEALAEIDQAKTTFFSNVSHEFRTPLTLMLAPLLDILAQHNGELPPKVTEELTVVHRNGLRLLKLVNTLLDFSRIEAGRVQASYVPTDIAAFTAELASVFRSAVEKAGLTLQINAHRLSEPAYIDRDMWEKIVLNLISNAFKFTLDGSITVGIEARGNQIFFTVADTGCGIPTEELPRLFERFHRVEGTRGRSHEGSGIGLALVQELVKIHGGTVTAESEVGRGTTFTVAIPTGMDHLQATRIATVRTLPSTGISTNAYVEEAMRWLPDADGSQTVVPKFNEPINQELQPVRREQNNEARPRVLVVDDNSDMRSYVARLLAEEYEVRTAGDGVQALEVLRDWVPSLILSDIMMPNLDGFGLIRAVRSKPALASTPIILLSARAGEEATLDGVRAGANDYLVKPFSARELIARVGAQIDRSRYERNLAAAEQRLQTAMAAAKMAAWEWNPATDVVTGSDTIANVYGLLPGGTIESSVAGFRLVHPQDVERHRSIVLGAVQRSESFHNEFRIIRPIDGRVAWIEERSHVITDPHTGQIHMVGLVMDVSERKFAEIALRRSEARSRFMIHLDDALRILTDPTEMSATAARLLAEHFHCERALYVEVQADEDQCAVTGEYGPNLPSIAGSYRISEYGADYIATVRANRAYVEHDTTRQSLSLRERQAFAALRIGSFISAPLFKSGRLVALFVVHSEYPRKWSEEEIEDVGLVANRCWESIERARVGRALAASEDQFALSVESAELGTFHCPMPMGRIVWNNKCKEHFWLPPEAEITFDLFYSILHPDDRERTRAAVERTIFHREPYDIEYRTVAPDDRIRWVRAKGSAYYDAAGTPTRFDGVTLDITELKIAEQRRDQLLAAERSAREEVEYVSRMKDEFLATLSHELRTPLNAILGWSQILTRGPLDSDDAKQGLEAIERNARAQTQMIEDLLDMSRIISGKVRLDVQTTVLSDVVAQAVQSVRPSAEVKGVRLMTVLDPYAGPVAGDPGRLQQVVWNLLTNAIKFTPKGGKIQIVLERVNSHLELSVSDDGEGIEPAFLPYVFERFRQADASTTRRHGGLGLGLNIVKQLVELHGGSVRAKSQGKGKGSTFTIMLPVSASTLPTGSDQQFDRQHPRTSSFAKSIVEPPRIDGLRVLVVDDDTDARQVMSRILANGGAIVTTASSVAEAMAKLQRDLPEIILSDIGMPGEDGYELIRKIRSLAPAKGGRIPAVALTAFARSEDRQRALLAGFQMHVAKPVEPSELLTVCSSIAQSLAK